MMKSIYLLLLNLFVSITLCFSQAGLLDSTFEIDGIAQIVLPMGEGRKILVLPDSAILVGGISSNHYFELVKFKPYGTLDSSFGTNGVVEIHVGISDNGSGKIALDSTGKILQAGYCTDSNLNPCFALMRYNQNGSLDNSFNGNGILMTPFNSFGYACSGEDLLIQPDGKIVEIGMAFNDSAVSGFGAVRFNSNGTLDNSFGTGGKVVVHIIDYPWAHSIAIQQDGKLLLAGYTSTSSCPGSFAILRLNSNGSIDLNFGAGGIVIINFGAGGSTGNDYEFSLCTDISIQNDGKILLVGGSYLAATMLGYVSIARLHPNGALDNNFGNGGKVLTAALGYSSGGECMTLQKDSKILVGGGGNSNPNQDDILLIRYNTNGLIDSTFGTNGLVFTSIDTTQEEALSIAVQQDNKIVITGYSNTSGIIVARYLPGLVLGVLDLSISENPILIYPNPIQSQVTLQYTLAQQEQISIELFDMQGKLVQQFITNETRTTGKHEEVLHLNELLPAGNYILSIGNGHNSQSVKIIKQ